MKEEVFPKETKNVNMKEERKMHFFSNECLLRKNGQEKIKHSILLIFSYSIS